MIHFVIIWGLIILFILQPGIAHAGAERGAILFATALLPYLLPYIILTQWLVKSATTSHRASWKGYIKAYLLGAFGGFPVGALTIAEMKKNNDLLKKESELLLAICHAPSPMFVLGFVGTNIFADISVGWRLLLAIHLANILFLLLYLAIKRPKKKNPLQQSSFSTHKIDTNSPLLDAIKQSYEVILLVATTVIFFSALGIVLAHLVAKTFSVDTGITQTLLLAIFEMTAGIESAFLHFHSYPYFPYFVAAIISMNGVSIHMQIAVIAKSAKMSIRLYALARLWAVLLVPSLFFLFN